VLVGTVHDQIVDFIVCSRVERREVGWTGRRRRMMGIDRNRRGGGKGKQKI
jgi:hypothetical protein